MGKNDYLPLFETKLTKPGILIQMFRVSMVLGIFLVLFYRISHVPEFNEEADQVLRRWAWIGLLLAELWFSFFWFMMQIVRWNPIYRYTFKDRLPSRFEKDFPGIDIFVCTADPEKEPPIMVVNTVLSVMAYDYPPEKLAVYLSDDGGSDLTFYAMLEASRFAEVWLPFCKKFDVAPRSPEAYFAIVSQNLQNHTVANTKDYLSVKKSYEEMKRGIENTTKLGRISEEIRKQHKGFGEWDLVRSRHDHQTIIQILADRRDPQAVDIEGQSLPTLVYVAREKRPQYHHNFKAGALNALIRVSEKISNGAIVLTVDCDMYSNDPKSVKDALCFFTDEEKGHRIAYIQYPQTFENITKNDLYSSSLSVICKVELRGMDGVGGPCYIGTGCFHRRDSLCGKKYNKKEDQKISDHSREKELIRKPEESASELEDMCKVLASCTYEQNTQWGKEMGLRYGCPVEDIVTGLCIQCNGWRSIYFYPEERPGFLGVAPTTLDQSLVQHKRWSEGDFQVFLSSYCPLIYGHNRIPLSLRVGYNFFLLWAVNSLPTLFYVTVPSLCLLKGISLYPKISDPWSLPFIYVFIANRLYGLGEYLLCGGTLRGWWNDQRMWLYKRTTSYFFGFLDNMFRVLGFPKSAFAITAKVAEEDVTQRYEKEVMEFGSSSLMFTILATLALLNAFCFVGGVMKGSASMLQVVLCGLLVCLNLVVYQGLFLRRDKGRMPASVTVKSIFFALSAASLVLYC